MLNVEEAVKWSRDVLRYGGLFYMDDFIGASRFQWNDEQLRIATNVRSVFSKTKYLSDPNANDKFLPIEIKKPDLEKFINSNPSEAADSDKILDTIIKYFPNAEIQKTGGIIYHLVLSNMLHNFDENNDKILLDLLLLIDELCIDLGQSHYGVALAIKEKM
ncbi:hypothetical protein HY745_02990 [Candidatus Desantisbacteria bacterium]|nr:hypothetical protein [Candidatus Desantisbacteria bacterium]